MNTVFAWIMAFVVPLVPAGFAVYLGTMVVFADTSTHSEMTVIAGVAAVIFMAFSAASLRLTYRVIANTLTLKSPVYRLAISLLLVAYVTGFALTQFELMNAHIIPGMPQRHHDVEPPDPEVRGS
jgi:hypothetical protein